jgi:hypothetical protein
MTARQISEIVMPGLDLGIHVSAASGKKDVDGRDEAAMTEQKRRAKARRFSFDDSRRAQQTRDRQGTAARSLSRLRGRAGVGALSQDSTHD